MPSWTNCVRQSTRRAFSAPNSIALRGISSVVGFVGLAEISGVGENLCAFLLHPQQRRAGVEPARKRDADIVALGQALQDRAHRNSNQGDFVSGQERSRLTIDDAIDRGRRRADIATAELSTPAIARPCKARQRMVDPRVCGAR